MWATIGKIFLILAVLVGVFLLMTRVHPSLAATSAPLSLSLQPLSASALLAQKTVPLDSDTGVILLDSTSGSPPVPYLAFESANHKFETKELIFDGGRGCQVDAGELPCVRNIDGSLPDGDMSPVPSGTILQVQGAIQDQALVVSHYKQSDVTPDDMQLVTLAPGQSMTLIDGTVLTPTQLFTGPSCTVGVGCVGTSISRVGIEIASSNHTSTTTTELVVGTLFVHDHFAIALLNILAGASPAGTSINSDTYQFLVARD